MSKLNQAIERRLSELRQMSSELRGVGERALALDAMVEWTDAQQWQADDIKRRLLALGVDWRPR